MSVTIALAQTRYPDDGNVLAMVEQYCARAAKQGAKVVVFPEALMTRFEESIADFINQAQPLDGPFATGIADIARRYGLWVIFTMNEINPGANPFNTAVTVDDQGHVRSVYRKVHLFNAQGHRESDRMSAGDTLCAPFETPVGMTSVAICYDLRFPEQARMAALAGAQVMVYPAAWVDGPNKVEQWHTLLKARAIENGMYVLGCGSADKHRCGASCVVAPDGSVCAQGPERQEALVVAELDTAAVGQVRAATPSLEHRRPHLYE